MRTHIFFRRAPILCCAFILAANMMTFTVSADELDKSSADTGHFSEAYPARIQARVDSFRKTMHSVGLSPQAGAKGIFVSPLLWPPSLKKINICFFNGNVALRQLVVANALDWTRFDANIPFDFGDTLNPRLCKKEVFSHIRIRLNDNGKNYSLLGILSYKILSQKEPSMQIQVIKKGQKRFVDPPTLRRVILHEFGHALALGHEHQSPFAKCKNDFNWDVIYKKMSGPPGNWDKKQIDRNMREMNLPGIFGTDFDKNSIMLYSFPKEFFTNKAKSECHSKSNFSISAIDRKLVEKLYPKGKSRRVAQYQKRRQSILNTAQRSNSGSGTKSAAMLLLRDLMPELK